MDVAFSALLGAAVHDRHGRRLGRLRDLTVELSGAREQTPVTGIVLSPGPGRRVTLRDVGLAPDDRRGGYRLLEQSRSAGDRGASREVSVRRDVLDSPVVAPSPLRRARVADVLVRLDPDGALSVAGLDLTSRGALARLVGSPRTSHEHEVLVPMSRVHLLTPAAHAAHVTDPSSWVFGLDPEDMAEVLTRVSVSQARDIIGSADQEVSETSVSLLHPVVRDRVLSTGPREPRWHRLKGWVLHRPGRDHLPDANP